MGIHDLTARLASTSLEDFLAERDMCIYYG